MRRWGLPIIAIVAAAVCVRLGVWQLDRLALRRALSDQRAARMAEPALEPARGAALDTAGAYRRVVASGAFDFTREVVEVGRSHRGVPGVHLVTPLRLPDGGAVLVVRGWAPSPDGRHVPLEQLREPDATTVEGVALPPVSSDTTPDSPFPLFVRNASPTALAARFPYPLAPLILQRSEPPPGAPQTLRALSPPELGSGPHLSYAIQWFAFAVIAVVGAVAFARKQGQVTGVR